MDMKNQDLDLAKQKLIDEDLNLVIAKNGEIVFKTKNQGINGFLQAIEKIPQKLVKASIADRIVGMAAAKLCIYSEVSSVFAFTISEGGIKILEDNNILYKFEKKVEHILNRNKTDICPFEKLAIEAKTTQGAYLKMKSLANKMLRASTETNC